MVRKLLILALSVLSRSAFATEIATVNGVPITDSDYKEAVRALGPSAALVANNPEMRGRFLDHLIENQLLSGKAVKSNLGETEEFKARILHAKEEILAEMYIEKYISEKTTDHELEQYFNGNKGKFTDGKVKASHILVKEEKRAEEILKLALAPNADFNSIARKYAAGTGHSNPSLGWIGRGRMAPEFEKAAFLAKKGEVWPKVVRTQFGFHVIKVEDIRNENNVVFRDVQDEVKQLLAATLRKELIASVRQDAKVEVRSDALDKINLKK